MMSAPLMKIPSRYTQRRCTSIQLSYSTRIRVSLSSQLSASSANTR